MKAVQVAQLDEPRLLLQVQPNACWLAITSFLEEVGLHDKGGPHG